MSELRKDPVVGRWVIISTERAFRPHDFKIPNPKDEGKLCPFCEGNEEMTPPEILAFREPYTAPNKPGWWVRVVPNKFPALRIEGELLREGIGMYDKMAGIGAHEVIIDSPHHFHTFAEFPVEHGEKIIWAYRDRMIDLKRDKRFKYILIFKNQGFAAGASLFHPHSQLIATPIVPKRVKEELYGALQYFKLKERCIFCDIIKQEKRDKERVILENEHFICFAPYASRFPFETCIIPKKHAADFSQILPEQTHALAWMLKEILGRIKRALNDPPYNYMIHTVPFSLRSDLEDYHWHIETIPRLVETAGFEWGSGFYINPTPPEVAAQILREC